MEEELKRLRCEVAQGCVYGPFVNYDTQDSPFICTSACTHESLFQHSEQNLNSDDLWPFTSSDRRVRGVSLISRRWCWKVEPLIRLGCTCEQISSSPSRYQRAPEPPTPTYQHLNHFISPGQYQQTMGRTQRSQGLAPPAVRKDLRAKQARHIVNKVIPALLASNARARKGSENSELIVDPPAVLLRTQGTDHQDKNAADEAPQYIKRKGQGRRKAKNEPNNDAEDKPTESLHIIRRNKKTHKKTASIEEATSQLSIDPPSQPHSINIRIISTDSLTATKLITPPPLKPSKKPPNPCILNMASPLRPGGGVLTGATSQEEFLCARTTLLPSLNESFYRLPEFGGVYTRDVLVFRSSRPLADAGGS
jgi:hypothetical protein